MMDPVNRTGVRLRPARRSDAKDIARLFRHVRDVCLPYLPKLHTPQEDVAYFAKLLESHLINMAEAEAEGIIGFCASAPGWIDHLYLDPRFHGRGIGHELLRVALADQQAAQLWVFQQNTSAIAFYDMLGFVEKQRTDGARNEEKCPDLLMAWTRR